MEAPYLQGECLDLLGRNDKYVPVCVLILSLTQSASPPPTSPTHYFLVFFLILNNLREGGEGLVCTGAGGKNTFP